MVLMLFSCLNPDKLIGDSDRPLESSGYVPNSEPESLLNLEVSGRTLSVDHQNVYLPCTEADQFLNELTIVGTNLEWQYAEENPGSECFEYYSFDYDIDLSDLSIGTYTFTAANDSAQFEITD